MEDRKDRDEQPALLEPSLNHGWFVTAIRNLREERCRAELNPHHLSGELHFNMGGGDIASSKYHLIRGR